MHSADYAVARSLFLRPICLSGYSGTVSKRLSCHQTFPVG